MTDRKLTAQPTVADFVREWNEKKDRGNGGEPARETEDAEDVPRADVDAVGVSGVGAGVGPGNKASEGQKSEGRDVDQ